MALEPDSWLDEKLLPLEEWDPIVIHQPTPLSITIPSSSSLISSSSHNNKKKSQQYYQRKDDMDTLHGYKSSLLTTLTNVLRNDGSSNGRNEWHEPLLFMIIDYLITFPLPLIGKHVMSLEHASAREKRLDDYFPQKVVSYNGYYYVCAYQTLIVSSWI
jgi:hypothetical protein